MIDPSRTEQQLREAVLASPDDNTPRLVYADWFQEHTDPRGEYITLQCGIADEDDARELRRRALWQHHGADWMHADLGFKPAELGVHKNAVYRRGFLDEVQLTLRELLACEARLATQPIDKLCVSMVDNELEALGRCSFLETVRCVELGVGLEKVSADVLAQFLRSPTLRRVEQLVFSPHEDAPAVWKALESFPRLAELKALSLSAILINSERASWLGRSVPALEALSSTYSCTGASLVALAEAATFQLRRFALMDRDGLNGRAPRLGDDLVARALDAPMFHKLDTLSLVGCHLREQTADKLAHLACSPTLETLNLGSQGHPAVVVALEHCELPALTWLSVGHNELFDFHLKALSRHDRLETLRADKGHITAAGVSTIIARLPRLRELDLQDNPIGDAGVEAIAFSASATSLRRLNLSNTELGSASAEALVESVHLRDLRELSVAHTKLGRAGLKLLAEGPFDRMEKLAVTEAARGNTTPLFEAAWLPYRASFQSADTYERRLDPTGQALEPPKKPEPTRAKKPAAPRAEPVAVEARELDPAATFAVGEHVRHPEYGVGTVKKVHALYLKARFPGAGLVTCRLVPANAIPFSVEQRFAIGDTIVHSKFGAGLVTSATIDRVQVDFAVVEGIKTLVHGRS